MRRSWWLGLLAGGVGAAVVLATVSTLNAAGAAAMSDGKTVCADVMEIINEYQRYKDLTEEMRRIQQDVESELQSRADKIDSLKATLDTMSPDDPARAGRMRELLKMQIELKNWRDLEEADITREFGVWIKRIYAEVLTVTGELAEQQGFDLVIVRDKFELAGFDPAQLQEQIAARKLLYSSQATDITQMVLDELNIRYRAQPKRDMIQLQLQP